MTTARARFSETCERDFLAQASLDPAAFAWLASRGQWQVAAHLDLLAERLLDVAQGKLKRLLIQMPPRHGKSEFASAHFPAWYLGTFPDRRVILASYEHDFAASWGAKARDRFAEFGPALWRLWVKRDKQAADDWQIAGHAGGMVCAGVGGPIMGRGADLLVIDDPVKSAEEADSETYRSRAWDWYRATAYTRLEPGGAILLIQTRWHEDDLAGRILAQDGGAWRVLSFAAVAEDGDPLGRAEGDALWPARYPVAALDEIRASVGPYWWAALYQQRPAPPEGALFRSSWWRYYETAPALDEQLISVDAAFKATDDSDYVVMQVWGRSGASFYLLDQVRERMDFVATCQGLIGLSAKWPAATVKLIEDSANGPAVISALHSRIHGIVPVKPKTSGGISDGSKVGRAQAILGLVEAGNVYLPQADKAPWVAEFTAECETFPRGVHDDQVDAMTQALLRWLWAKPAVPDAVDVAEERVRERELAELLRKHDKAWAWLKPKPVVRGGTGW